MPGLKTEDLWLAEDLWLGIYSSKELLTSSGISFKLITMNYQKNIFLLFLLPLLFFNTSCEYLQDWMGIASHRDSCQVSEIPNVEEIQKSLSVDKEIINLTEVNQAITSFANSLLNSYPETCSKVNLLSALANLNLPDNSENSLDAKINYLQKATKIFEEAGKNLDENQQLDMETIKSLLEERAEDLDL